MSPIAKLLGLLGALSLCLATVLGAYASHGLGHLEPREAAAVGTAVSFQFYYGLAVLVVVALERRLGRAAAFAAALFLAGMLLFCGGIYASTLLGLPVGGITPFGGAAMIGGWLVATVGFARIPRIA